MPVCEIAAIEPLAAEDDDAGFGQRADLFGGILVACQRRGIDPSDAPGPVT
jgi:hypothetical protein